MGEIKRFPKSPPPGFYVALEVVLRVFKCVWFAFDSDENGLSNYEVIAVEDDHLILRVPLSAVREFQIKTDGPPLEV